MENYISSFLLSLLTAITLYLVKLVLQLDKKVEVLEVEIKHLKDRQKT
ncbi:MAG: hypothetical protein ACP5F0_04285 [Sulfurihydrogenibium sp.]